MFDKKGIGIGNDDFKSIIERDCYFVDKSKFIEEIALDGAKVKLFCRPRRFGKTLNMSMLKYFFDIKDSEENRKLFEGLYIENSPVIKEQGKYPVIFLTMKEIKSTTFEKAILDMRSLLGNLYNQFENIRGKLNEKEREYFEEVWLEKKKANISRALINLCEFLYKVYNKKVILLIDEYDTPLLTAHEFGYYSEAVQFFKTLYGGALKSNVYLQTGVMTGIIRVAQAGIFSDLNNLKIDTILNTKNYAEYFGLLENEVEDALQYYGIDYKIDDVKGWYNGYTFGSVQVYNPWSILNYLNQQELVPFWVNTSSNYLIREILKNSSQEVFENLERLFEGEEIVSRVDSNVEVHTHLAENEIYSLMLFSGYLTLGEKITSDIYSIRIPNKEIMSFFHRTFIDIVFGRVTIIDNVKVALITKNLKLLEQSIEKLIIENLSFFDITQKENSYHMFLVGFLVAMKTDYESYSNEESGYGRADIILEPLNKNRTGYILELKMAKDDNELEVLSKEGIEQISKKRYSQFLESKGIKDIVRIGVAFRGKRVKFSYY